MLRLLYIIGVLFLSVGLRAMEDSSGEDYSGEEYSSNQDFEEIEQEPGVTFIVENRTEYNFDICEKIRNGIMLQEKCFFSIEPDEKFQFHVGGVNGALGIKQQDGITIATLIYNYSNRYKVFEALMRTSFGSYAEDVLDVSEGDPVTKHRYRMRIILRGINLSESELIIETAE